MALANSSRVKVLAAKFEDLVSVGLKQLISEDPNLELVMTDVPVTQVEGEIERHQPSVVLVNFGTLKSPAQVFQLHQSFPETRIVVLANRPTAAECNQMLSFGATACLSKETEARDIINAIHLASRGMHVLPRSAAAGGGVDSLNLEGSDLLTPREARRARAAPGRGDERADRAQALDRHRDRAHARAQHLPQARNLLTAGPGPPRPARAGRGRRPRGDACTPAGGA